MDSVHDYYVAAAGLSVLVHNCGEDLPEGYTSSPALKGDPYHPDRVQARAADAKARVADMNARAAQREVRGGRGPKEIHRIDAPEQHIPGSQWHAQEKGRGSPGINLDGTFHDKEPNWPSSTLAWLRNYGWDV